MLGWRRGMAGPLGCETGLRLQRRVAVVAGDERLQRPAVEVQQVVPQVADAPLEHHVLVDRPVLVAAQAGLEQPQVPARVPARVADPTAEEDQAPGYVVPGAGGAAGPQALGLR